MTITAIFAEEVCRLLAESDHSWNGFIALAVAGERLRRTCELHPSSTETCSILERYDAAIAQFVGPSIAETRDVTDGLLGRFSAYAATCLDWRDVEDGEGLLDGLDEVLTVGAAQVRAGVCEEPDLLALSDRMADLLRPHALGCPELAQFAEDHQLIFGPDPRMPELFSWWELFAEVAPTRLALRATVVEALRRERRIEQAVSAYASSLR